MRRSFLLTLLFASVAYAASPDVRDAYVPQPPPGQTMAVMFLTIHNPLAQTVSLMSASSELAARVELHTHVHTHGQMKMQALTKVELPAGRDTTFKPGGLHLMLFGLKRALQAGDSVPVSLALSDGSQLRAIAAVRDLRQ
ncbi:MAG TPA: copper chaperone PCu(A)C [Polyangiales bacterium]|nr:copper chaperone PCu(A)C [Polyangiales bacterium]